MLEPAEPARRTEDIEEFTNLRFIHPLAARLVAVLAARGIKPNAVSLTGMGFGILAGIAYARYRNPWFAVLGFVLMIGWHVMDGADGQLARLTKTQSELGKVLDGICDYVTFISVYVGLGITLARQHGGWVVALVAAAGLCHAVQAAAYETQRQAYDYWGKGKLSAALPEPRSMPTAGFADQLYRGYVATQRAVAGAVPGFDATMLARLRGPAASADAVRQRYRAAFAPSVRRWAILSSNYRTLGIFLCAVSGVPLVFFWFEVFGLSLILAALLVGQRRRCKAFIRALGGTAPVPGR